MYSLLGIIKTVLYYTFWISFCLLFFAAGAALVS